MKYICLGYIEPGKFEGMTEDERNAVFDQCFEHNDHLRANGHLAGEIALQPPETAVTLYWKNGKVATIDGPYAETKEQLGGLHILEARDLISPEWETPGSFRRRRQPLLLLPRFLSDRNVPGRAQGLWHQQGHHPLSSGQALARGTGAEVGQGSHRTVQISICSGGLQAATST